MSSLILVALLMSSGLQKNAVQPVKVYVFTQENSGGFADVDSKRRSDTVSDLAQILAKRRYIIVAERESADLVLEVTVSGLTSVENATTRTDVVPNIIGKGAHLETSAQTSKVPVIITTLRVPGTDYTTEFKDVAQRFWKDKAGVIADQFDRWVAMNAARLQKR